jgi:hypothetical protein
MMQKHGQSNKKLQVNTSNRRDTLKNHHKKNKNRIRNDRIKG